MCVTLGCNVRIAAESAEFCNAGILNGLTGIELRVNYLLPWMVRSAHATDILLTGKRFGGSRGRRNRLISRVVPDDELFDTGYRRREEDKRA